MKITILWSSLASYSIEFFRELVLRQGCKVQLIYQGVKNGAPYKDFELSFCDMAVQDSAEVKKRLVGLVSEFNPDCVLMSSWAFSHFMRLCKQLRKQGVYVVSAMDNQWRGTFKQRIGVLASKLFLKPSIDNFLVAGDRQADFARKLGYDDVLYGLYAADVTKFTITRTGKPWPTSFLFVGRLVPVKGIKELIFAYKKYRIKSKNPWALKIVGTGPLQSLFDEVPGVEYLGFVQPEKLPNIMKDAGCLVLPSLWEPWGVVIHEACAAGLPIIASYECGATVDFVRDGVNGFIVPPRADRLMDAMLNLSGFEISSIEKMSQTSIRLASLRNPRTLAEYFKFSIESRKSQ